MNKLIQGLALASAVGFSGFASAAYITNTPTPGVSPGDPAEQVVPGDNDYANVGIRDAGDDWTADTPLYNVGDTVLFGNTLDSVSADPFKLTFTYLGDEAGFNNQFKIGSDVIFTTSTAADTEYSFVYYGGLGSLDFSFVNGPGNTAANDALNGTQPYNFNLFYVAEDEYVISFDDGHPTDDNHDDMVIHVKASKVPEPGTLALLGLGLAGFALRRKSKA